MGSAGWASPPLHGRGGVFGAGPLDRGLFSQGAGSTNPPCKRCIFWPMDYLLLLPGTALVIYIYVRDKGRFKRKNGYW
jgi:hypothetical protein